MSEATRRDDVPESFQDLLSSKAVAVIATIGPKGEPQASPVWFEWKDGVLRFMVGANYQKTKNLQRDPRLTVTILDPARTERYIEFRGTCTISTDVNDEVGNAMARKYMDLDRLPWADSGEESPIVTVIPQRIITMG